MKQQLHKKAILDILKESKNGLINLKVHGNSMYPKLKPGDCVFLDINNRSKYKVGDIIVFFQNDNLIIHRLVKIKKCKNSILYCQKGDNKKGWSWIKQDQIIGKIAGIDNQESAINLKALAYIFFDKIKIFYWFFRISLFEMIFIKN